MLISTCLSVNLEDSHFCPEEQNVALLMMPVAFRGGGNWLCICGTFFRWPAFWLFRSRLFNERCINWISVEQRKAVLVEDEERVFVWTRRTFCCLGAMRVATQKIFARKLSKVDSVLENWKDDQTWFGNSRTIKPLWKLRFFLWLNHALPPPFSSF